MITEVFKKCFFACMVFLIGAFTFTGCSNDEDFIFEGIPQVYLYISVHSQDGKDLLDTTAVNNLITPKAPIAYFKGKTCDMTYGKDSLQMTPYTFRYISERNENKNKNYLMFGNLHKDVYVSEPLKLIWADGSIDIITIRNDKENQNNFKLMVNDRPVDGTTVDITK